jgi:ribosome maturation factor RimP
MRPALPDLGEELEVRLGEMGFELVEAGWAGSLRRPILRVRMDLPESAPGHGVTVDDCAKVSRALEGWLDGEPAIPERYVLEVSSPGVDRPLVRPRDWIRFTGETVVVRGEALPGVVGRRLEGQLLGLEGGEGDGPVAIILPSTGEEVRVPLDRIEKAHLLYRWD